MSVSTSKIAVAVLALWLPTSVARAGGPPTLDVSASCSAAARGAISVGRDKESCFTDERAAQDVLSRNWSNYSGADKTQCIGNVKTGGPPSYVELLSCLEVMRDAKKFREADPDPLAWPGQPAGASPARRR